MQTCELIYECAFYNEKLRAMPTQAYYMKLFFCRKEPDKCVRNLKANEIPVESPINDLTPIG